MVASAQFRVAAMQFPPLINARDAKYESSELYRFIIKLELLLVSTTDGFLNCVQDLSTMCVN